MSVHKIDRAGAWRQRKDSADSRLHTDDASMHPSNTGRASSMRDRARHAMRMALVVLFAYVLVASNILSPFGMAVARAYATDTPLVHPTAGPAESPASTSDEQAPLGSDSTQNSGNQTADEGANDDASADSNTTDPAKNPSDKNEMGGGTSLEADDASDKGASADAPDADEAPESSDAQEPEPAADGPEYQLPTTEGKNGTISDADIYPKLVVIGSDPIPGSDYEYLVRAGEEPSMIVDFDLGSTDALYGKGPDRLLTLKMQVPYLIHDENDPSVIKTTLNKELWEQDGNDMRLAIVPELGNGWTYYENGKRIKNPEQAKDGLSGEIVMQYTDNNGSFQQNGNLPKQIVQFKGAVPENVGAGISVGLMCTYKKDQNTETFGDLDISPDLDPNHRPSSPRRITFINTNLKWEQQIEVVNEPVLWDRYNYMVYAVTVRNTSETKDSKIKQFEFNLEAEPDEKNNKHILQSDIAAWEINEQGEIVPHENHDSNDRNARLIGKPGEGGVLIYDVTGKSPEFLAELDTDRFSNAEQLGLVPMEYQSLMDGYVNFSVEQELVSNGAPQSASADGTTLPTDHRTYYVALPYTTNLQGVGGQPPRVQLKSIASIYFGQNGEYAWSKDEIVSSSFKNPVVAFSQNKRAKNLTNGSLVTNAEGYLGKMGTFVIDGFSTQGSNIPVYGPESSDPAVSASGPHVIDTLPKHFELQSFEFQTKVPAARDVPAREVDQYFDTAHGPVEVELNLPGEQESSWHTLNLPLEAVADESDGSNTYRTWRVGTDTGAYEGSVAEAIAALEKAEGGTYTGRVRFLLGDEIPANKDLPIRIKVNGLLEAPKTEFPNTVTTSYGQRHWNKATAESPQGHYSVTKRESTASKASYVPVIEPAPAVDAVAHAQLPDGSAPQGSTITVPLGLATAGWRFTLTNSTLSKMEPSTFETSELSSNYTVDTVRLSKGLLDHAVIDQITLRVADRADVTLDAAALASYIDPATGELTVPSTVWNGHLEGVLVRFTSFDGDVDAGDAACIDLTGPSKNVQSYSLTGTFSTDYDEQFADRNKSAKDSATIQVQPAVPTVTAQGHTKVEADPQEIVGEDVQIPLSAGTSGWRFQLGNVSDTKMEPARFKTNELSLREVDGKLYGFHFDSVTLSKGLLEGSTISKIKLTVHGKSEPIVVSAKQLAKLEADGAGNKVLTRDAFWPGETLRGMTIEFDAIAPRLNAATAFVDLAGQSNYINQSYTMTGTFETAYPEGFESAQASADDEATLRTQAAVPGITVAPHGDVASTETKATATLGVDGAGWKFVVSNNSKSGMEPARFSISELPYATLLGKDYGFEVTKLVLSGTLLGSSKIDELRIYVAGSDEPVRVSAADIAAMDALDDGTVEIGPKGLWGDKLVTHIELDFISVRENLTSPDAFIDIVGRATKVEDFTLTGTFETRYASAFESLNKKVSAKATVQVVPAVVDLHTHAQYVDVQETTQGDGTCTDGSTTQIAVPYDRDFTLWAEVGNKTAAPLRDVDLSFALPLHQENDIKQPDGSMASAITGFHTTGITFSPEFLAAWGEVGEIHLYDFDTVAAQGKPDYVLVPQEDGGFATKDGLITLAPDEQGALTLDEAQFFDKIPNLKQVELVGWKGLRSDVGDASRQRVTFAGFSDSAFATETRLVATADNYFTGQRPDQALRNPVRSVCTADAVRKGTNNLAVAVALRAAAAAGEPWMLSTADATEIYVSKMYFDASARAAYYDGKPGDAGARFTATSTPDDVGHDLNVSTSSVGYSYSENNRALEIGYKALGSYLFDFRQYTNDYITNPEHAWRQEQYDVAVANSYGKLLSGKTYNTGAELRVTQTLPQDSFDAYYLKVRPEAVSHLKSVSVHYTDGTTRTTSADEWANTANALEPGYFRIDLLDDELGLDGGQPAAARDALADYGDDDFVDGKLTHRRVASITYTLRINQNQYADDTHATAATVDYGTDYHYNENGDTAGIEVTGRFFGVPGSALSTSQVDMTIGGAYSGNNRPHAQAQVRYQDGGADSDSEKRSSWSYVDYTYWGYRSNPKQRFKAGHVVSRALASIDRDEQYVRKGVHDTPTLDWVKYSAHIDGDTSVRFGSDQRFSMSFYRCNSNGGDWGANRVAFSDHTRLTDELPVIEWDADSGDYYGFLTTGAHIAGNQGADNQVMDKLESITFAIKNLDGAAPVREVTIARAELEPYIQANGGELYIDAAPTGQPSAPELAGKTALRVNVGEREALVRYDLNLSGMGGDGDGSREIEPTYDAERSNEQASIDARTFGRPYAYSGQRPTTATDVLNTFSAASSLSATPADFAKSPDHAGSVYDGGWRTVLYGHASDQAYFMGYLIPFQTRATLWRPEGESAYLYDYADDNNTPNTAAIQVKYQNRPDANTGVDDATRSARVSGATLHVDFSTGSSDTDMFRARTIYIPKQFVDGVLGGTATWFAASELTIKTGGGATQTCTLAELKDQGLLVSAQHDANLFAIDLEQLMRNDMNAGDASLGLVQRYQGRDATNTLPGYDGDPQFDRIYARPFISDVSLRFEAIAPDFNDPATTLAGGEWLSPTKGQDGYAFSYDGIYVDRTVEDFQAAGGQADGWNATSTPSFGKQANAHGIDVQNRHSVSVENPVSVDPNTWSHSLYAGVGSTTADFYVTNLAGRADVTVSRGKQVSLNGQDGVTVFAYDRDEASMTSPESYAPANTDAAGNNIPNGSLMAGDYIDYTVRIDAASANVMPGGANTKVALPLEHTQARFEAPRGQRIIGWEVTSNTTGIPTEQITAQFEETDNEDGDGRPHGLREAAPQTDYSLTADGEESYIYNRNLTVSIGELDVDHPDAVQIAPGTGVTLRIITQMTDELEQDASYQDKDNGAFRADGPSYQNDRVTAHVKVLTRPKHGYVQQRFINNSYTGASTLGSTYDTDVETAGSVSANRVDYLARFDVAALADGRAQFGLDAVSSVAFYAHAAATGKAVAVDARFVNTFEDGSKAPESNDGSQAEVVISGIENPTRHTQDMMLTVDFMKQVGSGTDARSFPVFQLTEAPKPTYPESMPANPVTPRDEVLVEYWDTTADGGAGAWVEEKDLVETTLPTSLEEAEGVERANRGEGLLGALVDFFAPDAIDPVGPSEALRAQKSKFHFVTAVRWTYFDVPATEDGTTSFKLDDVTLKGVGRYADVRPDTSSDEMADSFTGQLRVDLGLTHTHDENTAIDFAKPSAAQDHQAFIVKHDEGSDTTLTVYRSAPTFTFQTQTFQTAEQAAAAWNPQAPQKTGYVPGESFWYKDSLTNMAGGVNPAAPNLEGEAYNPAIYERIPSRYLVNADGSPFVLTADNVRVAWYDQEGNEVSGAEVASVERIEDARAGVETGEAPDFGGSMNYDADTRSNMDGSGESDKGLFSDMDPTAEGVSNTTAFDLYRITFTNDAAKDGEPVFMNPGDRIEIWFEVTAATDGLPQVFQDTDEDLGTSADQSPAYYPRIGEYATSLAGNYHCTNPLHDDSADGFGPSIQNGTAADAPIKVQNDQVLMDMDALLHDVACSADKPEQSDLWEAFDASRTYIPGSSVNSTSYMTRGTSGNNDVFLDADVKTGMFQQVQYVPRKATGATAPASRAQLPGDTFLVTPNTTQANASQSIGNHRDYAAFVTGPRTRGDIGNLERRWGSKAPLVWSESSLHMQKAWLAAASDMEPNTGDYKSERQYEAGDYTSTAYDPHYLPWADAPGYTTESDQVRAQDGVVLNKYAASLEYNQDFTARLQALNYGDRNLDGVEMLYIMPRGIEPKLPVGVNPEEGAVLDVATLGASAHLLASVDGVHGAATDAVVDETYHDISNYLRVEVVQTPYGADQGYRAPSDAQDPGYYRDGTELSAGATDLSQDPAASSYQAVASAVADRTSSEYAESSQPWVLKITVTHPLAKWYGRNIDTTEANTADADGWQGDAGYKLHVDIPAHVFANNASGTWNDRVLVTPWNNPDSSAPSPASSYFSVMDVDHVEGMNAKAASMNDMQVYGMDFMWALPSWYNSGMPVAWQLTASSPNMPSVNGYTVLNNSVLGGDALAGKVADRASVRYDSASKAGQRLWAQTGTRAVMRKPMVRTWNTVGDNGVTGEVDAYYFDVEFDRAQMNVHVENRYWWDQYGVQYESYAANTPSNLFERASRNYSVDGGQKGDLVLPVVTCVLPQHIAPIDEEGNPYPTDGASHTLVNWQLSCATAEDYAADADALATDDPTAKSRYTATVTYENVAVSEDGTQAPRYVVRFVASDPAAWNTPQGTVAGGNIEARIPSGGMNTFKFPIASVGAPTYDAEHPETARSYENAYTFVSSKLPGAQLLTDADIPDNPFAVGSKAQLDRTHSYGTPSADAGDMRLDAVQDTKTYGSGSSATTLSGGVIPYNQIGDGSDTVLGVPNNTLPGASYRYAERNADGKTPNVEDYTFRAALHLDDALAAQLNGGGTFMYADPFPRSNSTFDTVADSGAMSTLKLRVATPRLVASHGVEFDPSMDVPSLEDDDRVREPGAPQAGEGQTIGRDGTLGGDDALQYGDTPWYRATLANDSDGQFEQTGAILHGKLVFAVHLPSQVTFYDKQKLTDGSFTKADAGRFYVEWTHVDRATGDVVTEQLTPQDLIDQGWYVHVSEAPDWGANDFTQPDYAKPDADDPDGIGTDPTAKPKQREGETLVFEFAPPHDATAEEFARYDTLLEAARAGVHADGYFGSGDSLTLFVKTRVDNTGAEGDDALTTAWLSDASEFYATVHDLDGRDWDGEDGEDGWISTWRNPEGGAGKPVVPADPTSIFDAGFAEQLLETIRFVNPISDAPATSELALGWPLVRKTAAQDFDCDGAYDDIYTHTTSGTFALARPESSVRIDTKKHRSLVTNPDLGDEAADDASLGAEQVLLLDQAVNEGGAVNSMIVDWDVPYRGTGHSDANRPTLDDEFFDSSISEVSTGIWEIPGASVEQDALPEAQKLAAYEQQLRVFMLVRVEPLTAEQTHDTVDGNVTYFRPGTAADRAEYASGDWRVVGSQAGYPVREGDGTKRNTTIELYDTATTGHLAQDERVKQIRWVVKAFDEASGKTGFDALADDTLARDLPVPAGFRLDVDAAPDEDPDGDGVDKTLGKQEMDDLDPKRMNIGWTWERNENGELILDKEGLPELTYKSPMPQTVTERAAHITAGGTTLHTLHMNHFAQLTLRFDDTKFAASDEARAGYYRDKEHPYLGIEMQQYYFNGDALDSFTWVPGRPTLDITTSRMMKYRITLKNLSTEQLAALGTTGEGDVCTNPDISAMLPFISALPTSGKGFEYVPYDSMAADPGCILRDDYATHAKQNESGQIVEYAQNLDKEQPLWTYYVTGENTEANPFEPILESTEVGSDSVRMKEQLGPDLKHNRQYLSMHFGGSTTVGGESIGRLNPGQDLVVEFMMPVREDAGGVTSTNLMDAAGFVHKPGNYTPYIPTKQEVNDTTSFVKDVRDSNLDGDSAQLMLMRNLSGLGFEDSEAFQDIKSSTTQLDTLFTKSLNGVASAPEGTDFTYSVQTSNQNSKAAQAQNYIWPVVYDVLPHEGDTEAYNQDSDKQAVPRGSAWNAWLTDLGTSDGVSPAIEVVLNDPNTADTYPDGMPLEADQYELWVGPFTKEEDGTVRAADMDALPELYAVPRAEIGDWVRTRRDNVDDIMHTEGFVTLAELQAFVAAHPEQEEALRKNVRAIWCSVKDKDVHLPPKGSLELRYQMHTPLNLPKYLGDTTKTAASDEEKLEPIYQRMLETSQWNSFFHFLTRNGEVDTQDNHGELSQAGVMVDAPENRGYIGDYVWLDADWSGIADDTAHGASDYEVSANGRSLLAGARKDGSSFKSDGKLKDLDGDGVADDPGINGVTVELLNKYGLPVNRDGKVAKYVEGAGADGQDLWLECDPETGEPITDNMGSPVVAEAGGPLTFTTESDYYGNEGYYILSNLAVTDDAGSQMTYRLRLTFPAAYAGYSVTTTTIGEGVAVAFDTTEVDGEQRLVATTGEIAPTPLAYDAEKFAQGIDDATHAAYDASAVSHDVGIALPVSYSGVTYRDDVLASGAASEPIDGYLDSQIDPTQGGTPAGKPEQRLANVTVSVHEFDPATQEVSQDPALDAFGKPAVATTDDTGAFTFALKPHRSYVLRSTVSGALVKPSPYLWSQDPSAHTGDNDLYSLHGQSLTHPFEALPPRDADGKPDYVVPGDPSSGYVTQGVFALGYVDGTIGFIGDTVWEDTDHDGVQDASESGVAGVEVTLEQYWWDSSANNGSGAWRVNEQEPVRTVKTNDAGTYVFKTATAYELPATSAASDAQASFALAGYRVRIDRDDLDALGYAAFATRQRAGSDTELDSDLSVHASDAAAGDAARTYYLVGDNEQLIVAAPAGSGTAAENVAPGPDGKKYDLVSGETRSDIDAGLVRVPTAAIDGVVWEDLDRDGLQDIAGDDPVDAPMANQQVSIEQYYLDDGAWVRNDAFGADEYTTDIVTGGVARDGVVTVRTDAQGAYAFDNLPVAYAAPGVDEPTLAGYRLRLTALASDHTLTRYHASMPGQPTFDTTRVDSDVYNTELMIVDRESFDASDNTAGERANNGQVLLAAETDAADALWAANDPATARGYDALAAGAATVRGGDVGQEPVASASVAGRIWQDLDNDGIQDDADVWVDADDDGQLDEGELAREAGVADIEIALTRYLADPASEDGWVLDQTFGEDGTVVALTDEDGTYTFDKLETARRDEASGTFTVYGYRVALADPEAVAGSWHIARYQQGDDAALDSDLVLEDGSLVDVAAAEYLVLLEEAGEETAETNRADAPASIPQPDQGLVTYDVTASRSEGTHDGGLLPRAAHDIAGYLWHDADYDGLREAGETGLAEKEVTLHRWVWRDGAWQPCPDALAAGPTKEVLTDESGRFVFDDEPVAVRDQGAELLMGYTVTVRGRDDEDDVNRGVAGLPVTAVQVETPAADAANSKAQRPSGDQGDVEIAWRERDAAREERRTLDGKLVLATPASEGSHPAYTVGAFDVSFGAAETRMNAGFGPFAVASLAGIVWDDAHYDGLQQLEDAEAPEQGMAGVTVCITQWYQADDGTFVQNESFGDAAAHARSAVTDEQGAYRFDNLPTHVQLKDGRPVRPEERGEDDFRLAAYRVLLPEMPEGYAVTRYHAGDDPALDSDLESSEAAGDLDIIEVHADQTPEGEVLRGDGFAIVAEPIDDADGLAAHTAYEATYGKASYDVLRPSGLTRGGDAGLVQIDADAAIDGTAWIDADADGVRGPHESGLPGVSVTLTRYMRMVGSETGGWAFDASFAPQQLVTDAAGRYRFEGLPSSAYRTQDNQYGRVLYGYRVNVNEIPHGYAVAALHQGDDLALDSDLDMNTTRVVPDEAVAGLTVLSEPWEADEDKGMRLAMGALGTFTAARSHDAHHLDAGLVPQGTGRVAGLVWEDADQDGLQTPGEYLRVGQRVMLDRRIMTDNELEAAGFGARRSDGAPGSALDDAGEPVIGAEPGEPILPEGGAQAPEAELPRIEFDGILSNGDWEEVAVSATDLTGHYAFEDLAVADEVGRPYVYRVRMLKPEGAEYVPFDVDNGRDNADARDNDYAHLNVSGTIVPEEVGVTGALTTMAAYEEVNAYGQPWDLSAAAPWDREHDNSVDLAVYLPPEAHNGIVAGILPRTGDEHRLERLIALGAAAIGLLCIALALRERRYKGE